MMSFRTTGNQTVQNVTKNKSVVHMKTTSLIIDTNSILNYVIPFFKCIWIGYMGWMGYSFFWIVDNTKNKVLL